MKRDKDQLLTVGAQVYSSEARYSISHARHQKVREKGEGKQGGKEGEWGGGKLRKEICKSGE